MPGQERGLIRIIIKNFINSLKPRQIKGNVIGADYIGNQYFEIPADPQAGKRKPKRWYDPPKGHDFEDQIPSEWEAWLRLRRTEPPTAEEIERNSVIMLQKKENAARIEAKRLAEGGSLPTVQTKGPESFPSYSEYHYGHSKDK